MKNSEIRRQIQETINMTANLKDEESGIFIKENELKKFQEFLKNLKAKIPDYGED